MEPYVKRKHIEPEYYESAFASGRESRKRGLVKDPFLDPTGSCKILSDSWQAGWNAEDQDIRNAKNRAGIDIRIDTSKDPGEGHLIRFIFDHFKLVDKPLRDDDCVKLYVMGRLSAIAYGYQINKANGL